MKANDYDYYEDAEGEVRELRKRGVKKETRPLTAPMEKPLGWDGNRPRLTWKMASRKIVLWAEGQ